MTNSILHKLATEDNLQKVWASFWKTGRKSASGIDGITPTSFNSRRTDFIHQISAQIRSKEGYRFSPLRGHAIPKKNGNSHRILCIPTISDRIVQRLIAAHLCENDKLKIVNDVSFGFISSGKDQKRGVNAARDRAIELRNQSPWAYKSDISAFFDRIPRQKLIDQTLATIRTPSFRKIITDIASCEIEDKNPMVNRVAAQNGIKRGLGLRQGMPLSPIFSNVILRAFDNEMIRRGKKMVRYADDFIVMADSRKECLEIDRIARDLLQPDFSLPTLGDENSKTYIAEPNQDIEFLGLALSPKKNAKGYELIITEKQFDKISRSFGDMKNVGDLVKDGIDITMLTKKIENKISGYLAAYGGAQNKAALTTIVEKYRSEILRSIFSRLFGEQSVQKLTREQRKFLCLMR